MFYIFWRKNLPVAIINVENLMTSLVYSTDTNGCHLLRTYYMAGNVLSILHTSSHLVLEADV